ncbi:MULTISPECIES: hopanoid C-3 methylase HpnR [Methylococcus]|uniref:Hopanoid C-3 methylase HpnR n=1 Tax=Methylococcus capsulatus TaxID=414 RepID=A0ABZ2F7S0_METCP|nr:MULTISPECIES: hopanoid C-3 methylase HpnR [Methylococcus]MDF9393705.1 hopanoid C-3 methylase HpnR [Methylococcus capsulatus]
MKVFCVHPSPLMYTKVFLRLEPLGLELVAESLRRAGHDIRLMDLQVESHADFLRELDTWRPDVVCFSLNYLANVPEVIDLAKTAKTRLPACFTFVGGHSASFVAKDLLDHGEGLLDCVLRGEGEAGAPRLLETLARGGNIDEVPGVVSLTGEGPPPGFTNNLDEHLPARDLLKHRRKYFLGTLDPCASIEFSRGCPWDCSFCSAWTFYGRSYRVMSTERIMEDLRRIKEPGIFIVDDVAFIQAQHGMEIGEAIAREGIRKQYYLETRGDVLLRNKEVFKFWKRLGMEYMFLGVEAIDAEGLQKFRKRVSLGKNFEALEFARSLGITVAINLIADPDWDRERFEVIRQWCMEIPEIVNISVNTPYPGTESWHTESRQLTTRDYRLFDIQHAVLPTRLPLPEFYGELVKTQQVLYKKHMGWAAARDTLKILGGHLLHGQTNFLRSLWKFNSVFNPELQLADHRQPVKYPMSLPPPLPDRKIDAKTLYVHRSQGRKSRALDDATEKFVDEGRMGAATG